MDGTEAIGGCWQTSDGSARSGGEEGRAGIEDGCAGDSRERGLPRLHLEPKVIT